MAAAGAMWRRHSPNGGIQWLRVVLHRMMHPALYRRIRMAIKIASVLPAFFVIVNFIAGHNRPNS
jgi:hypothetical protein